jgi:hypothetical protein
MKKGLSDYHLTQCASLRRVEFPSSMTCVPLTKEQFKKAKEFMEIIEGRRFPKLSEIVKEEE